LRGRAAPKRRENSRPGAKKREPNKKTNILSREFFPNVAVIIIVSGQKLIFQSALKIKSKEKEEEKRFRRGTSL
ncbi:MAG: hypothetical protein LBC18_07465, partial [Opitutaceae bacterium]|nr:hypothetical protein [Opitutaceae bacterium]